MQNNKIYDMAFAKIFPLLISKAERKLKKKEEVYHITAWLTGYQAKQIDELLDSDITYGDFFLKAPKMNPKRHNIKGVVCGVRVENITEPLMQDIRYLDKMIDELAKGKSMDKILRE